MQWGWAVIHRQEHTAMPAAFEAFSLAQSCLSQMLMSARLHAHNNNVQVHMKLKAKGYLPLHVSVWERHKFKCVI